MATVTWRTWLTRITGVPRQRGKGAGRGGDSQSGVGSYGAWVAGYYQDGRTHTKNFTTEDAAVQYLTDLGVRVGPDPALVAKAAALLLKYKA